MRKLFLAVLVAVTLGRAASAQITDANWISMGDYPGLNGVAKAAVWHGDVLYVGGAFTVAGNVTASRVAKWDGTRWSALGAGVNGQVNALNCDSAGNLYVGGDFTAAGDIAANRVAKWDGTQWSALGLGVNATVNALLRDSAGNLHVGGDFTTAGAIAANRVAKWDGTQWSTLGTGMDASVLALARDSVGNLYAGGAFKTADGASVNHVARWNGLVWSSLGVGMAYSLFPAEASVNALACDSSGKLYAGGSFDSAGRADADFIACWNGLNWSALGAGMDGQVRALGFDNSGNLYAGGAFALAGNVFANSVARWDGVEWAQLGSGVDGETNALAFDFAGDLYASGSFTTAGGKVAVNIGECKVDSPVKTYTVAFVAAEGGSISGATPQTVVTGGSCAAVTAVAGAGHDFSSWDHGFGTANPLTVTDVDTDMTITASFAKKTYTVRFVADIGGTLQGQATQTVEYGGACLPVTATPDTGYVFSTWDGGYGSTNPLTVSNVTADLTVVASFALRNYTVTFVAGDGGAVIGQTTQIVAHGSDCSSVMAVAFAGHRFSAWDNGFGTTNPLTVTDVTSDMTITASFALNTYTVHFVAAEGGSIVGVTTQTVASGGACLPVTATPDTSHVFTSWDNGFGTVNPLTVTDVTSDMTITASFAKRTFIVVFTAGDGGHLVGDSIQEIAYGDSCTPILATPDDNHNFANWSDGSTANPLTVANVTANLALTANFTIKAHTVTFVAADGGSIVGDTVQTVENGAACLPVTATPDTGHLFTTWDNGFETANPLTVTNVTADMTITAYFAKRTFTVSFAAGDGGAIAGETVQTVEYGDACLPVTATPDTGHSFTTWDNGFGTVNPLTLTNVTNDMIVTASFAVNIYTVEFVDSGAGSIDGDTIQHVPYGGACSTVTAVADTNYRFASWDNGFGAVNPLTVASVTANMTITASFVKKDHPEFHVARGSAFTVEAADLGLASFAKKPKVEVPGGGRANVLNFTRGATSLKCQWNGKDAPGTYSLMVGGTLLTEEFVVEKPTVTLLSSYTGNYGDRINLTGMFLGSKAPLIRMVYAYGDTVRRARCNVVRPYNHPDAKNQAGKSVMNVDTGVSSLTFVVPKPITTSIPATMVLDCNNNYIEIKFNNAQ